jgi:hypothetical protein
LLLLLLMLLGGQQTPEVQSRLKTSSLAELPVPQLRHLLFLQSVDAMHSAGKHQNLSFLINS